MKMPDLSGASSFLWDEKEFKLKLNVLREVPLNSSGTQKACNFQRRIPACLHRIKYGWQAHQVKPRKELGAGW